MSDKNIYRKVGRRYIPVGVCEPINWLPDGIWLVRSMPSCKSRSNMKFLAELYGFTRLGDIPVADFTKVAKYEQYERAVSDVLTKHDVPPIGICIADMAREIIKAMYDVNEGKK